MAFCPPHAETPTSLDPGWEITTGQSGVSQGRFPEHLPGVLHEPQRALWGDTTCYIFLLEVNNPLECVEVLQGGLKNVFKFDLPHSFPKLFDVLWMFVETAHSALWMDPPRPPLECDFICSSARRWSLS